MKKIIIIFLLLMTISCQNKPQNLQNKIVLKYQRPLDVVYTKYEGSIKNVLKEFNEIERWMKKNNLYIVGPKIIKYLDKFSVSDTNKILAEIQVQSWFKDLNINEFSDDKFKLKTTVPIFGARIMHQGPHHSIGQQYDELVNWIIMKEYEIIGHSREYFYNDSLNFNSANVLTEIFIPLEEEEVITDVDFAIYVDKGAFYKCIAASRKFFEWSSKYSWIEITAPQINDGGIFDHVRAIYFPGGWAEYYNEKIDSTGINNIRSFIKSGGKYLGTCAGAYFASKDISWEGVKYPYRLGLFSGYTEGPIEEIAPWPQEKMTGITLNSEHSINNGLILDRQMYYLGGPTFHINESSNIQILASYAINDNPAAITLKYGAGKVVLIGAHPEYEENSPRDGFGDWPEGFVDPETDWDFLDASIKWLFDND